MRKNCAGVGRRCSSSSRAWQHDPGAVPDVLRAEGWLVGTPDQIISQLQALADEGVERVMFQHNDQTDFAALELLARDVMPAVTTWT